MKNNTRDMMEYKKILMPENMIRIITFATSDYKRDSRLLETATNAGYKATCFDIFNALDCIPWEMLPKMSTGIMKQLWRANPAQKPYMLRNALEIFSEPIIWYSDADSELIDDPDKQRLFNETVTLIANHKPHIGLNQRYIETGGYHWNTGTMFIRRSPEALEFINEWIRLLETDYRGFNEQVVLNYLMSAIEQGRVLQKLRIAKLPFECCYIEGTTEPHEQGIEPLFLHHQKSRTTNPGNAGYEMSTEIRDGQMREAFERMSGNDLLKNNLFKPRTQGRMDRTIDPGKFCIVGTAASGGELYDRIPKDAFVIACNGAIEIMPIPSDDFTEELDADAWLCIDNEIPSKPYFNSAMENFHGIKIFKYQEPSELISFQDSLRAQGLKVEIAYTRDLEAPRFPEHGENLYRILCLWQLPIDQRSTPPVKGELRNGGTVAGFGVQLAWYFGAREIYLYGVEMSGNKYTNEPDNPNHDADAPWLERIAMQAFIDRVREDGVRVIALTPTVLDCEKPYEV